MRILLSEIEAALKLRLYGPALIALFAIPDAAATVQYGSERPNVRYPKWFDEHIDAGAAGITGEVAWLVRNALVHQTAVNWGTAGLDIDRLRITVPSKDGQGAHGFSIVVEDEKPVGVLELGSLSAAILAGARAWLDTIDQNDARRALLDNMIQYRPLGYGLIAGVPVIA